MRVNRPIRAGKARDSPFSSVSQPLTCIVSDSKETRRLSVDRLSSGGLVSWWKKALSQTEGRRKASIVLILKEGCQPHDFIEPVTLRGGKRGEEISLTGRIPAGNFSFYQRTLARNLSPISSRNGLPILVFSKTRF